jgi:carbon-monoxide dehydrogenase large subunit
LANILGISPDRIRVIAPDVGGAFGMKGSVYPEEVLAVWAALHHRRNLRWIATRSEDFLSASHGRGLTSAGQLALGADGRFLGLTAQIDAPLGYWLPNSGLIPAWNAARVLPGGYDIDVVDITTTARLTQRPPMGLYRGAGRPEANILMERLVEKAARVTGLDPFDLRRRNLRRQLPARTATGNMLDSGDYPALLEMLRDKGGWDAALARRDACRAQGRLAGVGMAFYVEPSGEGWESARVTSGVDGRAEVASGSSAQGQWRATAFAQIAADALGLCLGAITVRCGDTGTCPEGIGALASRSTPIGGSAVLAACRAVKARRDSGEAGEITEEIRYETDGQAWGYGAFLAELDVDGDTGAVTVSRMVSVDDTGVVINPALVRGQIIGGAAQGLGEALMERLVFDEDGQLLTGSFMDYALPRAADMPPVEVYSRQTASPLNLLGAKGVGEAGTIGAPAAILNAALDALGPVGVRDLTMPLTPSRVWAAIRNANQNEVT